MIVKYGELNQRTEQLEALQNYRLPRKFCTAIARNLIVLREEVKIKEAQELEIAKKYAKKDENDNFVLTEDNRFTFEVEALNNANKELIELLGFEVDLDLVVVPEEELDKCDSAEYDIITPKTEIGIMWMIGYKG